MTATTLALTLPTMHATTGTASAKPKPGPRGPGTSMPSQAQVDRARAEVARKKQTVVELEAALAAATARMETASLEASMAAESYNGAMWRLGEARKASQRAAAAADAATANVERQRAGIVTLVTDSYQNGTELNTATAMMGDDGPRGLMNRYAVVSSAGDSMEARYEAFRVASAQAQKSARAATKAKEQQKDLAAEAKGLAVAAGQAASAAGAAANQIADQKQQLIAALAKAENISIGMATARHAALERIARKKAAAAAMAVEASEQAALKKAAKKAKKRASAAKPDKVESRPGSVGGDGHVTTPLPTVAPPVVVNPAPNQAIAVKRAIAYAKAQIGKPYLWAAAGPAKFDCSGLTMQAWARGGVALPHYSVAQFAQSTRVSMRDARAGDLLFWSNNGSPSGIHHVAIYLGGGQFIEAPRTGLNVRYNSIYNWYPDFVARP